MEISVKLGQASASPTREHLTSGDAPAISNCHTQREQRNLSRKTILWRLILSPEGGSEYTSSEAEQTAGAFCASLPHGLAKGDVEAHANLKRSPAVDIPKTMV